MMPNWLYDLLKWVAIICLPAFKNAIPRLFEIWGWPLGPEIAESLDIVAVLLGALLGMSCATYRPVEEVKNVEDIDHQAGGEDADTDKG